MLNVGIVGLGTVSPIHVSSINNSKYAKLVAVCDLDENNRTKAPNAKFYLDYNEMFSKENLDVVHICLPHYLHVEVAIRALEQGIHVLLEKPVDIGYKETENLINIYEKYKDKLKLGICFQNRYNKTSRKLKEILEKEGLENVFAVKGIVTWYRTEDYYKNSPWRGKWETSGGGVLINQAIHTLDLMHYLTGKNWLKCNAKLMDILGYDIEVDDSVLANIDYEDNVHGLFFATNSYSINDSIEVQVVTTKDKYTIRENRLFNRKLECLEIDEISKSAKSYYGCSHEILIDKFYQSIINDTDDYCSIYDAKETMELVQAIKDSNRLNKRVRREEIIND